LRNPRSIKFTNPLPSPVRFHFDLRVTRHALEEVDIAVFALQPVRFTPRNGVVRSSIHRVGTHRRPRSAKRSREEPVEGFLQNRQIRADNTQVGLNQRPATSRDEIVGDVCLLFERFLHSSRSNDTGDQDTTPSQQTHRTDSSASHPEMLPTCPQEGRRRKA
jgi:hypothetical protein